MSYIEKYSDETIVKKDRNAHRARYTIGRTVYHVRECGKTKYDVKWYGDTAIVESVQLDDHMSTYFAKWYWNERELERQLYLKLSAGDDKDGNLKEQNLVV